MNQAIEHRVLMAAETIAFTGATVRAAARVLGVSKSTVHKDVTVRLKEISPALHKEVMRVLMLNKAQRHIRGGEATRLRYARMKEEKKN